MIKRLVLWVLVGIIALLVVIQFLPVAGAKTNPPVVAEPVWDSPQTRELAVRACYDCHSNETVWPWYSNVAPVSWRVISHTNEGREHLNFSEWNIPQEDADDAGESVLDGSMPIRVYLLTHSGARLTDQEKAQLAQGLDNTMGSSGDEDHSYDDDD